jgi:hypothetical protein
MLVAGLGLALRTALSARFARVFERSRFLKTAMPTLFHCTPRLL